MKTAKLIMTSLFVAGTTFLVAETLPSNGPLPFNTYDTDGNNVITSKEFDTVKTQRMTQKAEEGRLMMNAGNSPVFSDIDTNKDGIINQNEYKIHQENRLKARTNQQNKMMINSAGKIKGQGSMKGNKSNW